VDNERVENRGPCDEIYYQLPLHDPATDGDRKSLSTVAATQLIHDVLEMHFHGLL